MYYNNNGKIFAIPSKKLGIIIKIGYNLISVIVNVRRGEAVKKENFFLLYILISTSILYLAYRNNESLLNRLIIIGIIAFFGVALINHFREIKGSINGNSKVKIDYESLLLIIGTALSAALTWYLNHGLGYGPIIANGIVGVVVGLVFSSKKAGAFYTASFIGMSSQGVVSSMTLAGLIGLVAGFVIVFSQDVYAGVGGKGGTTAALSTQLIRLLMGLFT